MKKNAYASQRSNIIPFSRRKGYAYPNAAEQGYFLNKAVDCALAALTSLGTVVILFVLIILG